jgi:Asp-tRNA(Asn)/Glu-tRNA(Gln) amidotransferase C subunit
MLSTSHRVVASRKYLFQIATSLKHRGRSSKTSSSSSSSGQDIESIFGQPSWSVSSLLAPPTAPSPDERMTKARLHHLLRLSALPLPSSQAEEDEMIRTLQSQLHFVRAVRGVDTAGVEPLQGIRDESPEAREENEITLESMRAELDREEVVRGRSRRIRRKDEILDGEASKAYKMGGVEFDPLERAGRTAGRFIVVETGRRKG